MKRFFYLILSLLSFVSLVKAQDTKMIGGVAVSLNKQHPDKFILEDDFVKITLNRGSGWQIDLDIINKTNESIQMLWNDSYLVLSGETFPVDNAGISKLAIGVLHTSQVNNMKAQTIAPKSKIVAQIKSDKYIFDMYESKKYYKENGEILVNRVVPTLFVKGEKKEYPITIELYTKSALKK